MCFEKINFNHFRITQTTALNILIFKIFFFKKKIFTIYLSPITILF